MNDDAVMMHVGKPGKIIIDLQVQALLVLGQMIESTALQAVMEAFGNLKEFLAAMKDAPSRMDTHVVHEQDQGIQYFGNAASLVGGIDMNDMFAVQTPGSAIYLRQGFIGHNVSKVF